MNELLEERIRDRTRVLREEVEMGRPVVDDEAVRAILETGTLVTDEDEPLDQQEIGAPLIDQGTHCMPVRHSLLRRKDRQGLGRAQKGITHSNTYLFQAEVEGEHCAAVRSQTVRRVWSTRRDRQCRK